MKETRNVRDVLHGLIGTTPDDKDLFKSQMRQHQGWWRTAVLCENPGRNPRDGKKEVCNTIEEGKESRKNFLSESAWSTVKETIREREEGLRRYGKTAGIFDENRLHNNLLSSQPLAFNFFGELKCDLAFATQVIRLWEPEIEHVIDVRFEYAPLPKEEYTSDSSAFDVAFFCQMHGQRGLVGLEVKYTDEFSREGRPRDSYRKVFDWSRAFAREYQDYFSAKYIQLFRNELLAESMLQRKEIDFVTTGLFCHQDDENACRIGEDFQEMMINGQARFKVITYKDYLERVQRLDLKWGRREWLMMLWARYCAACLSDSVFNSESIGVGRNLHS